MNAELKPFDFVLIGYLCLLTLLNWSAYRTQASTAGLSTKQLITNLIKSKAEELGLVAATKILQAALVGLNIALALGASYLISKGISAWQEYSQRIETAATKSKEAADTAKQTTSSLKELVNTYEELGDKSEWDSDSYNQANIGVQGVQTR